MTRRAKRLRRLILLSAAVTSVGLTAALVTRQKNARHELDAQALRYDGLAAYAGGDFVTAVAKLDRYVVDHHDDAAALLPLAVARSKVEAGDGQHIRAAVRTLTRVMELQPHNAAARRTLLELMLQTGDTDAMDALADDALAIDAADAVALRARLAARLRQGRWPDALATAIALAKVEPHDVDTHALVLHLMSRTRRPAAEGDTYAAAQFTADDPRRVLLCALADVANGRAGRGAGGPASRRRRASDRRRCRSSRGQRLRRAAPLRRGARPVEVDRCDESGRLPHPRTAFVGNRPV